jgi:hypothetical protein
VFGRVVVDQHRLRQLQLIGRGAFWHAHDDALAVRRPQIAVARDRLDVLMAGDHPVTAVTEYRLGLLVPPHRRRFSQLCELGHRNALFEDVGIGEVEALTEGACGESSVWPN